MTMTAEEFQEYEAKELLTQEKLAKIRRETIDPNTYVWVILGCDENNGDHYLVGPVRFEEEVAREGLERLEKSGLSGTYKLLKTTISFAGLEIK